MLNDALYKSHCLPWIYIFSLGQAYVALSRVRTLDDVLWDFPIPEHENDDGIDPKSIQFACPEEVPLATEEQPKCGPCRTTIPSKCHTTSMVEGDHANQSLLTQVTNLKVVEEGHPSIKILAMNLNERSLRWILVLVSHR